LQNLGNTKYSLLTSPCRPIAERYSLWVLGGHALLAFDFFTPSYASGSVSELVWIVSDPVR